MAATEKPSLTPRRRFYIGVQNDATFIISGEAPAMDNDYPRHDADRTCIAKVYDEAEAKRLVDAANAALGIPSEKEPMVPRSELEACNADWNNRYQQWGEIEDRLRAEIKSLQRFKANVDEALNTGNGTYKP